ncbi:MAG: hypothetical protein K940chlam2_01568 [Chlamydiae bacterium]|nr:hypothetical protein [Chlamydiota bacterium]
MAESTTQAVPGEGSRIGKDMLAWERSEARLKIDEAKLKQMCAMIGTMQNPLIGCQMVMQQEMYVQGDQVEGLSAASNVSTDIRNQVMGGQSDFNAGGTMTDKQAKQMYQAIKKLKSWLEHQASLGKKSIMSPDGIKNMLGAIKGISDAFGKSWGNPAAMVTQMTTWEKLNADGKSAPKLKAIQDQFQTLNQTVSAFATTTNTQLQYQTEQYKQLLGIYNDINSTYLKFIGTLVKNQKSQ